MSGLDLDKPITLRAAVFILLAWAAEYAMLTLIEDAPEALKVGTMLCATAGLGVLYFEKSLRAKGPSCFLYTSAVVAIVWLCFVSYALQKVRHREEIKDRLSEFYSASSRLAALPASPGGPVAERFQEQYKKWENETAEWIGTNISESARYRFLSHPNPTQLLQNTQHPIFVWMDCPSGDYNCSRTRLEEDRRNLIAIMESKFYGD